MNTAEGIEYKILIVQIFAEAIENKVLEKLPQMAYSTVIDNLIEYAKYDDPKIRRAAI